MTRTSHSHQRVAILPCLLGLLLWLSAPCPAAADAYDEGLLFRLTPRGAPPGDGPAASYLLGTIHSEDPRVVQLPEPVRRCFDQSDVLVMEVVPDVRSRAASAAAMSFHGGRTLAELLPADVYDQTVAALAQRGLAEAAVRGLKPWAVTLVLSMPPAKTGEFLDLSLYRQAVESAKPVLGIESIEEQLGVFEGLTDAEQIALLRETLASLPELPVVFEALVDAYGDRDLARLMALGEQQLSAGPPALAARFRGLLLDRRNARMARRIRPLAAAGGHFFAIGALHLPGPGGVLQRLSDAGFRIERVY